MDFLLDGYFLVQVKEYWYNVGLFDAITYYMSKLIIMFYRLPEMKNRTYEELGTLVDKRVHVRKFKGKPING